MKLELTIGAVSQAVEVSPQTLRLWESERLVRPLRSKGGTRYYGDRDVERLREIKYLRLAHGLNFAAIRRELGAVEGPPPDGEGEDEPLTRRMGERLRRLRTSQGRLLKEVAADTGLSVSFLSALERGYSGASIASLRSVAKAYGVSWREFFEADLGHETPLITPERRPTVEWPNGVRFEDLSTNASLMDPAVVYVPPRSGSGGPFSHSGEEFVYVLSGKLFVELEGDDNSPYQLSAKDTLYFPSSTAHRWWTENEEAEVIYVNSPRSF